MEERSRKAFVVDVVLADNAAGHIQAVALDSFEQAVGIEAVDAGNYYFGTYGAEVVDNDVYPGVIDDIDRRYNCCTLVVAADRLKSNH